MRTSAVMWTGGMGWVFCLSACGPCPSMAFVSSSGHTATRWKTREGFHSPDFVRRRIPSISMSLGYDSSVSRRSLLERAVSTAFAAPVIAAVAGTRTPSPASAKGQRLKGGGPIITLEDGAQYQEMTIGDGATPHDGDRVAIHYSLFYNGLEVESSRDSQGLAARPLGFTFGTPNGPGSIPPGLNECIEGMQVGGRRKITLPPQLAFGKEGRPPFIPGDATVLFDVSLWSVKPAGLDPNLTLPGSSLF